MNAQTPPQPTPPVVGGEVPQSAVPAPGDKVTGTTTANIEKKTVDEIIGESKSRRRHRTAAALLVYVVVFGLIASVMRIVFKIAKDLEHLNPAAVGLVASLVVAISVLTIALAKYSFGLGQDGSKDDKVAKDAIATPSVEAFKVAGDLLGKVADALKSVKP